jgi:hypothetical protein
VREEVAVDPSGVRDHDHFSSVGGVDLAPDEPACFEPVDHTGDSTGRQAGEFGEPTRGGRSVQQQQTKRPKVCRV